MSNITSPQKYSSLGKEQAYKGSSIQSNNSTAYQGHHTSILKHTYKPTRRRDRNVNRQVSKGNTKASESSHHRQVLKATRVNEKKVIKKQTEAGVRGRQRRRKYIIKRFSGHNHHQTLIQAKNTQTRKQKLHHHHPLAVQSQCHRVLHPWPPTAPSNPSHHPLPKV